MQDQLREDAGLQTKQGRNTIRPEPKIRVRLKVLTEPPRPRENATIFAVSNCLSDEGIESIRCIHHPFFSMLIWRNPTGPGVNRGEGANRALLAHCMPSVSQRTPSPRRVPMRAHASCNILDRCESASKEQDSGQGGIDEGTTGSHVNGIGMASPVNYPTATTAKFTYTKSFSSVHETGRARQKWSACSSSASWDDRFQAA